MSLYNKTFTKNEQRLQDRVAKIKELKDLLLEDSTATNIPEGDLKVVGHCPEVGYTAWLFDYKGVPVLLWDASNGHYEFNKALVSFDEVKVEK